MDEMFTEEDCKKVKELLGMEREYKVGQTIYSRKYKKYGKIEDGKVDDEGVIRLWVKFKDHPHAVCWVTVENMDGVCSVEIIDENHWSGVRL